MRVVLITGAAGGLGRALTNAFHQAGWAVAMGYHRSQPMAASGECWPVPLDVTQPEQAAEAVRQVGERWGRIDALINNAGITDDGAFAQMREAQWDRVLDVNLRGAMICSRAVLPGMMERRDGHIVNISSWSGRAGQRGQANYAAAKAGLLGFTAALAREAGPSQVRVNAILPGVLPTGMTAGMSEADLQRLAGSNVLGTISTLEEVSAFIAHLAGTRFISGQVFQLDSRIGRWT